MWQNPTKYTAPIIGMSLWAVESGTSRSSYQQPLCYHHIGVGQGMPHAESDAWQLLILSHWGSHDIQVFPNVIHLSLPSFSFLSHIIFNLYKKILRKLQLSKARVQTLSLALQTIIWASIQIIFAPDPPQAPFNSSPPPVSPIHEDPHSSDIHLVSKGLASFQ